MYQTAHGEESDGRPEGVPLETKPMAGGWGTRAGDLRALARTARSAFSSLTSSAHILYQQTPAHSSPWWEQTPVLRTLLLVRTREFSLACSVKDTTMPNVFPLPSLCKWVVGCI